MKLSKAGKIDVILVSGDNKATAVHFAIKAGILLKPNAEDPTICMTGEEFRSKVGKLKFNKVKNEYELEDQSVFNSFILKNKVKVIARATPEDKQLLSVGFTKQGKTVAVTGEGINDIKALTSAAVGFSMNSGVSATKNASKMILAQDNIMSIINAILWGRNIYSNVRKFIQFQLTVNFTTLVMMFISAFSSGTPAFSTIQLLWINMIMDMLAAIALAAERPQLSIINNPSVKNHEKLITKTMWKQIIGMSGYITLVMAIMFFFIDNMWDLPYSYNDSFLDSDDNPTNKNIVFTLLFNTFIYLHMFNQINCRKIQNDQFNVFSHILNNCYFLVTFSSIVVFQYFFVNWGGKLTRCAELKGEQHAFCVLIGSTSLIASFALKLLPTSLTDNIPAIIDERKANSNNFIIRFYKTQTEAKVFNKAAKVLPE